MLLGELPRCILSHRMLDEWMSDPREAYLCAVGYEEDVYVDKKHQLPIRHLNGA
jgi:hypothetical protein